MIKINDWKKRIEEHYSKLNLQNVHEKNGTYYAKLGSSMVAFPKIWQEKIVHYKLSLYGFYEQAFPDEEDLFANVLFLKNQDSIEIQRYNDNKIKKIHFYTFQYPLAIRMSRKEFLEKGDDHQKIFEFVEKEFINQAPNRIDFLFK
jgi:hypothetical protein